MKDGAPCQLKKPFKGPRRRRGSCWEERKRILAFPRRGVIDLPSWQINGFFTKRKRIKIELVSRPATNQLPPPAPPDKPLPLRPIESQCVINIAGNKFLVVPHPTATNQNNATNQPAAKKGKGETTFYFCFISWLYSFEHLTVLDQYDLAIRKLS